MLTGASPDMLQGLAFCKCLWQDAGVRKWSRILFVLMETQSRYFVAIALVNTLKEPENFMPVLVMYLNDRDANVRQGAAEMLGWFGAHARQAVPDLLKSLADSDATVRENAKEALKKIDPEAEKKAGVK